MDEGFSEDKTVGKESKGLASLSWIFIGCDQKSDSATLYHSVNITQPLSTNATTVKNIYAVGQEQSTTRQLRKLFEENGI